jgi:hypothetical protein
LKGAKKRLLSRSREYAQLVACDWLMDTATKPFRSETLNEGMIPSATFSQEQIAITAFPVKREKLRNFSI